jgi:hypothetical protein
VFVFGLSLVEVPNTEWKSSTVLIAENGNEMDSDIALSSESDSSIARKGIAKR